MCTGNHAYMRDVVITVVALLVLALGMSVILLYRRVGQVSEQVRESDERRTAERIAAAAEVRRILGDGNDSPRDEDGKRRRHLRAVPAFVGLGGGALTLATLARRHPLPAAGGAVTVGAIAAAVLSTPADQPRGAMPEPPTPHVIEAPDFNKPPRHPTSHLLTSPTRPGLTRREPPAPPTPVPSSSPTNTAAPPSSPPEATPPTEPPPGDPPDATNEPAPPNRQCVAQVDLLGIALELCATEPAPAISEPGMVA